MKYSQHGKYIKNCYLQRHEEQRVLTTKITEFQDRIVNFMKILDQKIQKNRTMLLIDDRYSMIVELSLIFVGCNFRM